MNPFISHMHSILCKPLILYHWLSLVNHFKSNVSYDWQIDHSWISIFILRSFQYQSVYASQENINLIGLAPNTPFVLKFVLNVCSLICFYWFSIKEHQIKHWIHFDWMEVWKMLYLWGDSTVYNEIVFLKNFF